MQRSLQQPLTLNIAETAEIMLALFSALERRAVRAGLAMVFVACFAASLPLPVAYACDMDNYAIDGFTVGLVGPMGVFLWAPGWLANPLFIIAILLLLFASSYRRGSVVLASLLGLLALSSFAWREWGTDEAVYHVCTYGPGFYLWMLAMLGSAATLVVCWANEPQKPRR